VQFRIARNKVKWQFLVLHPVSRHILLKFSYIYIVNKKSYLTECPGIFVEKKEMEYLKLTNIIVLKSHNVQIHHSSSSMPFIVH